MTAIFVVKLLKEKFPMPLWTGWKPIRWNRSMTSADMPKICICRNPHLCLMIRCSSARAARRDQSKSWWPTALFRKKSIIKMANWFMVFRTSMTVWTLITNAATADGGSPSRPIQLTMASWKSGCGSNRKLRMLFRTMQRKCSSSSGRLGIRR